MGLLHQYSNRPDLAEDLAATLDKLAREQRNPTPGKPSVRSHTPPKPRKLADRLTPDDVQAIIREFQAGTAAWRLAKQYGVSLGSVKNLLRQHKARHKDQQNRA